MYIHTYIYMYIYVLKRLYVIVVLNLYYWKRPFEFQLEIVSFLPLYFIPFLYQFHIFISVPALPSSFPIRLYLQQQRKFSAVLRNSLFQHFRQSY